MNAIAIKPRSAQAVTRTPSDLRDLDRALKGFNGNFEAFFAREKQLAFAHCTTLEEYEAHCKRMCEIPQLCHALFDALKVSHQFRGDLPPSISRAASEPTGYTTSSPVVAQPQGGMSPVQLELDHDLDNAQRVADQPATSPCEKTPRGGAHARAALIRFLRQSHPGIESRGRNVWQTEKQRIVATSASGGGPWRFHLRNKSLLWAGVDGMGQNGIVFFSCSDIGYATVSVAALNALADGWFIVTGRNHKVLRPSLVLEGGKALIYPCSPSRAGSLEPLSVSFVEA